MKLVVAGSDCTEKLGPALRREAADMARGGRRRTPPRIAPAIGALALREARTEAAFLGEWRRLLRYRDGVDTLAFEIPRRPSPAGWLLAGFKRLLWTLLRYQHDRIVFRQNLINHALVSSLEFEAEARDAALEALARRVADLERKGGA